MWKDDQVGYCALHEWIKSRLIKPQTCRDCNQVKPLDLANISQEYKRNLSDWEWLCRKCHMTKDGRALRLSLRMKKLRKNRIKITCKTCKKDFYVLPCRKDKAKYCRQKCQPVWNKGLKTNNL